MHFLAEIKKETKTTLVLAEVLAEDKTGQGFKQKSKNHIACCYKNYKSYEVNKGGYLSQHNLWNS